MKKDEVKLMVGIQIGDTKLLLSEEEARALYDKLDSMFGQKTPGIWRQPYTYEKPYLTWTSDRTGLTIDTPTTTTSTVYARPAVSVYATTGK